jgi:hypothetical protein
MHARRSCATVVCDMHMTPRILRSAAKIKPPQGRLFCIAKTPRVEYYFSIR